MSQSLGLECQEPPEPVLPKARPSLFTPAFLTVALAGLIYFTAAGIVFPALPRYVVGPLRSGNVAVGLAVGAFSVSAFFLRPWAGGVADRRGRRPLTVGGASLFAVSVLGYLIADSPVVLALFRLLTGAGEALFFVGATTAQTELAPPDRRGEAMSYFSVALYLGIGIGPIIGETVIDKLGFSAAWMLAASLALVAAAISSRIPETRATTSPSATPHRLVNRKALLPGLVLLSSVWGMAGYLAFVPLYALDVGIGGSGVLLGLFAGIVVAIRTIGARIPDRFGPGRITSIALAVSAAGLAIIGLMRTPAGLVGGTVVLAVGIALFTPALFAFAVEGIPPDELGSMIGTTSAFLDLAFGLGPATLGFVAAAVGRPGTFLAGSAVAVAGLALVLAGVREGRR